MAAMSDLPPARVVRDRPQPPLARPPRRVPRRLVWKLCFGTREAWFVWIFTTMGVLGCYHGLPRLELSPPVYDRAAIATIDEVAVMERDQDGGRRRIRYSFVDHDGVLRHGELRSNDRSIAGSHPVSYDGANPDASRLDGVVVQPGWVSLVAVVIAVVGLGFAFFQWHDGRRAAHLLRFGVETRGRLVKRENTGFAFKRRGGAHPVLRLTFAYQVAGGRTCQATVSTSEWGALEDDAEEAMLYDPSATHRATTLDHLPGAPTIGTDGQLASESGDGFLALILPLTCAGLAIATAVQLRG
jgi:hypothetical protein